MNKKFTGEELLNQIIFLLHEKRKIRHDFEKLAKTEKKIDIELAELISSTDTLLLAQANTQATKLNGKMFYTFQGRIHHANHAARLAIEELGAKYTFDELKEIVNSSVINPWAKTLKVIVEVAQIHNTGFIDPERRYFTKYPLKSKDGVYFFVTTQWDVRHKTRTGIIEGSFLRLIDVLKKHGIEIHESGSKTKQ